MNLDLKLYKKIYKKRIKYKKNIELIKMRYNNQKDFSTEYKRNLSLDLKPLKQTNNREKFYLLTPLPLLLPNFL